MTNAIQALVSTVVASPVVADPAKSAPVKKADKKAAPAKTEKKASAVNAMKQEGQTKTETAKAVSKASKATARDTVAHVLADGARPASGRVLFAFTMAWLQASGLLAGGTVSREKAQKIAGSTMVGYSTKQGRLSDTKGQIGLTDTGRAYYAARGADQKTVEQFVTVLTQGKTCDAVKNPSSIIKA